MDKKKLIEMGMTEGQAKLVMEALDGAYVTKSRFNEVNRELSALKSAGDAEALKEELKREKIRNTVEAALLKAKAYKPETVKPLLAPVLQNAETDEHGQIKGLDEAIKALTDGKDTKFLFDQGRKVEKSGFSGVKPADSGSGNPVMDLSSMSYEQLCEFFG
ncbi:MAG: phage scaffolding protein [Oscillospiraceae bacterium]|nr:phage scaffolding protein [Oscillospiraceae bacterium]